MKTPAVPCFCRESAAVRLALVAAFALPVSSLLAQESCGVDDQGDQDNQTLPVGITSYSPPACPSPTAVPAGTPFVRNLAWSTGTKQLVCIRVNLSDLSLGNQQSDDANTLAIVADKYKNVYSRQHTIINPTVIPSGSPFPLQHTSTYYTSNTSTPPGQPFATDCEARKALWNDAVDAAKRAGYTNVDTYYDRVMVHHPRFGLSDNNPGESYSDIGGKRIWMNSGQTGNFTWRLACHEVGHSYGCRHTNMWRVASSNPVDPSGHPDPVGYADWFDIMGGNFNASGAAADFNEDYKYQLGWIVNNASVQRVQVLTSGFHPGLRLYQSDDPNCLLNGKAGYFAITFSKDATYDYWLGYRLNITNATQGAYVKWGIKTHPHTYLIDWVPSTTDPQTGYLDAPVPLNGILKDPKFGSPQIVITVDGFGQDSDGDKYMTLDVTVP